MTKRVNKIRVDSILISDLFEPSSVVPQSDQAGNLEVDAKATFPRFRSLLRNHATRNPQTVSNRSYSASDAVGRGRRPRSCPNCPNRFVSDDQPLNGSASYPARAANNCRCKISLVAESSSSCSVSPRQRTTINPSAKARVVFL